MKLSRFKKLNSLILLALLAFSIGSTFLHWHDQNDVRHDAHSCALCMGHSTLSSALPSAPIILAQKVLILLVNQSLYDAIVISTCLEGIPLARAPPRL